MNQTPPKLIFIIVMAVALLDFGVVGTLCASLFLHTYADPAILTALITTAGLLTGSLVTMLSSTRTQAATSSSTQTTTTTTPATETPAGGVPAIEPQP